MSLLENFFYSQRTIYLVYDLLFHAMHGIALL